MTQSTHGGTMEVNIHNAKTHLSRLLRRVARGQEITIARSGVPIARLVPIEPKQVERPLGLDRGAYEVPEDLDAPLPAEVLASFYGKTAERSKRNAKSHRRKRP